MENFLRRVVRANTIDVIKSKWYLVVLFLAIPVWFVIVDIFGEGGTLSSIQKQKRIIAIQPFKGVDNAMVDTLKTAIERFYAYNVIVLQKMDHPKSAFVQLKSPRYRADSLIHMLKRSKPDSVAYVIGLTQKDISTTKKASDGNIKQPEGKYKDWGIFGLGFRPGPSCIVSTYRLKHPSKQRCIERFTKVSLHELGHNMGLPHCPNAKCFMRDAAETINTIDEVELDLCEECRKEVLD